MRKIFSLQAAGKDDARVRDKIRHEVNKYARRQRQKAPPVGFDAWEFACKIGPSQPTAESRSLKDIGGTIDLVAKTGATEIYIEIVAVPVVSRSQKITSTPAQKS